MNRRKALNTTATVLAAPAILGAAAKPKSKYVQIGTGHPHANKMSVYRASDEWEVIGIVEPDPERRKSLAGSKLYGDLPQMTVEQALDLPGLDAVGIETEIRDLLKYAEMAIDVDLPIHLDKPAGVSFPDFQRLYQKADAKQLPIQMGYMYRFNPAVQFMRDCLEKGWLGEPFEVHTVMSKVVPPKGRESLAEFSGGIMFELAGHIVDLTVDVLGNPDQVTAYPRTVVEGDGLVDNMLAVFEYPKATATVKSSAVEVEGFARRHFVVAGTEGTLHIQPLDRPAVRLALSKARGDFKKGYQDISFESYQRYVGDAAELAAILRGEREQRWGSAHDLAVQEALLRASGMPVD